MLRWPFKRAGGERAESTVLKLLPLTPEYNEGNHKVYLDAIEDALSQGDSVKNIALTGGYGVGKSSVLKQLNASHQSRKTGKALQISLSTLGLADGDGGGDMASESPTNRIQKEIVKQLLYREEPHKMPGSRFRRIAKPKYGRSLGVAALGGFALTLVFYLAGWTAKLASLFFTTEPGLWFQIVVFGVLTTGCLALLVLLHNRVSVKGLKVASAEIALASAETTYFDQFLDEVVYFFDVTDYDIVIFEDIDRFDDPHIFETLRALNTLLNGSKQLDDRNIRFVYAIKDSIFELLGTRAAGAFGANGGAGSSAGDRVADEVARANRTKFFDVVIPIVPFITHKNARDLTTQVFEDINPAISGELIDLAARHLPDMRLIKNVRNEFLIFRSKVFGVGVDLSQDELFAMMLYKNTHLVDFELIRTGQSRIDDLYRVSRELVRTNVSRLGDEANDLRHRLSRIESAATRGQILGVALVAHIDRVRTALDVRTPLQWQATFQGTTYSRTELEGEGFWHAVLAASDNEALTVPFASQQGVQLVWSTPKEQLALLLDDSLSPSEWDTNEEAKVQQLLATNQADQAFLRHASFAELYRAPGFLDGNSASFRDLTESTLESVLARQLVGAGFVSGNFALYTSTYYGDRVSPHAQNFLIHNLDRNVMDVDYVLDGKDVAALIRDRGDGILEEQAFYNVSVVDYLLEADRGRSVKIARALTAMNEPERQFWDAYMTTGTRLDELIAVMASVWGGTLMFVTSRDDLIESRKIALVNLAMLNAGPIDDFRSEQALRDFITDHAHEIECLRAEATTEKQARIIATILRRAGIRLSVLSDLSESVREAVIEVNCYRVSADNLRSATNSSNLALDRLKTDHAPIYEYVQGHLGEYLDAVEGEESLRSIAVGSAVPGVLTDVVDMHPNLIERLLDLAGLAAGSVELQAAPPVSWPALADHDAFPLTFENVQAYINEVGQVDSSLGRYLSRVSAISVTASVEQDDRQSLGKQILHAQAAVLSPDLRVALIQSLDLNDYVDPTSVPSEGGSLIGLLIGAGALEDSAASYRLALNHDWATRECVISESREFVNFMSPNEVPVSDIPDLLRSGLVSSAIKDVVIDRFDEFISIDDPDALKAAAEYVVATKKALSFGRIARISAANVARDLAAGVLALGLADVTVDQLSQLEGFLGEWLLLLLARDGTRPKIPNSLANRAIAEHLKTLDAVSSIEDKGDVIQVNLRKS